MEQTKVLLNAYYEALYERLEAGVEPLKTTIERLLPGELAKHEFPDIDQDKYNAYLDACLAFLDERLEAYNPIGLQYTFDRAQSRQAAELELQLDWYDSRAEFETLAKAAREKSQTFMAEQKLNELAAELIEQFGAFPDKSIISAYEARPALAKLPDYIVARAIEQTLT